MISVKSVTDVITNSSSEAFMFRNTTGMKFKEVFDLIMTNAESAYDKPKPKEVGYAIWKLPVEQRDLYDSGGGCGGFIQVFSWIDMYKACKFDAWLKLEKKPKDLDEFLSFYTPETWGGDKDLIFADLDNNRYCSIKFMKDLFGGFLMAETGGDYYFKIDPVTKIVEKGITKEEYDELPDDCRETADEMYSYYDLTGEHLQNISGPRKGEKWGDCRFWDYIEDDEDSWDISEEEKKEWFKFKKYWEQEILKCNYED